MEFLQSYRAMPQATTGVSPFELLHKRKMRTKLNIFPVVSDSEPLLNVRDTIVKRQTKSKECTDQRRGATILTFQPRGIMGKYRNLCM